VGWLARKRMVVRPVVNLQSPNVLIRCAVARIFRRAGLAPNASVW